MCFREGCTIPPHKNILVSRHHLHRHARHWHGRASTTVSSARDICDVQEEPIGELDEPMEDITPFANQDFDDTIDPALHSRFRFLHTGTAQFADWCIAGSVTQATNCLVQQSLVQAPVSLFLDASSKLPSHAIQLFLHISQMLVTTGQKHHTVLAQILTLLLGLIPSQQDNWPTMPSTMASFQSHILNPTNKHSLVSLLPIPNVYMLSDDAHAY